MGAIQSLQEKFEDVSALAEETAADSTPVRPANKRFLALDPRSPSEGIDRTPIVVEKTPNPKQSLAGNLQGKVSTGLVVDPRSPTADFTRTPINPCLASSSACLHQRNLKTDIVGDPRSPAVDFTRTPINPCLVSAVERQNVQVQQSVTGSPTSARTIVSESGIGSAEVTPIKDLASELNSEGSPDSAFSVEVESPDKPIISCEVNNFSTPTENNMANEALVQEKIQNIQVYDSTPKLSLFKSRPQALGKLAMEATKLGDSSEVQRSPLSSVNNSRAGLGLQHKNMIPSQGYTLVGSSVRQQTGVDKENCPH